MQSSMLSDGVVNDVLVLLVSMHTDSLQPQKINFSTLETAKFCAKILDILCDVFAGSATTCVAIMCKSD